MPKLCYYEEIQLGLNWIKISGIKLNNLPKSWDCPSKQTNYRCIMPAIMAHQISPDEAISQSTKCKNLGINVLWFGRVNYICLISLLVLQKMQCGLDNIHYNPPQIKGGHKCKKCRLLSNQINATPNYITYSVCMRSLTDRYAFSVHACEANRHMNDDRYDKQ